MALAGCGGGSSMPPAPDAPPSPDGPMTCPAATYQWAVSGAGGSSDRILGAALDPHGNVWVTGTFIGAMTLGSFALSAADTVHPSIFVAKLDPTGKVLVARALQAGSGGADGIDNAGTRIAVDAQGNAYVVGTYQKALDVDGVHLTESDNGNGAAFLIGLDPTGTAKFGATTSGNTDGAEANDVAIDASGDVYVTGEYNGDATFGAITVAGTSSDKAVFVAKYAPSAGAWSWAKGWAGQTNGTNDGGVGTAIAVTGGGNVYVTGTISGTLAIEGDVLTADGGSFVVELAAADATVRWRAQLVPSTAGDRDSTTAAAVDAAGAVYITGSFQNRLTFQGGAGPIAVSTTGGGTDMFLAKLGADGTPAWAKDAGLAMGGVTRGDDVAFDGTRLYVGGFTQGPAAFDGMTLTTTSNLYVAAYDPTGAVQWVQGADETENVGDVAETAALAATSATADLVIAGSYTAAPKFGDTMLTATGEGDAFAAQMCK